MTASTVRDFFVLDSRGSVWKVFTGLKPEHHLEEQPGVRSIYLPQPVDVSYWRNEVRPFKPYYLSDSEHKQMCISASCLGFYSQVSDWSAGMEHFQGEEETIYCSRMHEIIPGIRGLFLCKFRALGASILLNQDTNAWNKVKEFSLEVYLAIGPNHPIFRFSYDKEDSIRHLTGEN